MGAPGTAGSSSQPFLSRAVASKVWFPADRGTQGPQRLAGCWPETALHSFLRGSPHEAAQATTCFIKVSGKVRQQDRHYTHVVSSKDTSHLCWFLWHGGSHWSLWELQKLGESGSRLRDYLLQPREPTILCSWACLPQESVRFWLAGVECLSSLPPRQGQHDARPMADPRYTPEELTSSCHGC